jgi:hypothetical protein
LFQVVLFQVFVQRQNAFLKPFATRILPGEVDADPLVRSFPLPTIILDPGRTGVLMIRAFETD